jgi:hypothetical protein
VGKKISAVVFALVAAQLLSGCFVLRELNWSTDKVKPGNKTTATISFTPSGSSPAALTRGAPSNTHFFLAVLGPTSDGVTFKRPKFDSDDVTNQKEKLTSDDEMFDYALQNESCNSVLAVITRGGSGPPGELWRSQDPVNSNTNEFVEAKLKAKVDDEAPGGGFFGFVFSGYWDDDGDGVVEDPATSDDVIECAGQTSTSFLVKGPIEP